MLSLWILALLSILNKISTDFIKALRHLHDDTGFKQLQEADFLKNIAMKGVSRILFLDLCNVWMKKNAAVRKTIYCRPVNRMAELESQLWLIKLHDSLRKNSTLFSSILLKALCWTGHLHWICNYSKDWLDFKPHYLVSPLHQNS